MYFQFNPIVPNVNFADIMHTVRYTEKMVSAHAHKVTCTWWLLWLAVEMPWLALGGPILALVTQIDLENTTLTL